MERTRTAVKLRYKKIGGGSLRFKKRIIKQNQIFEAYKEEIPKAFWKSIIQVGGGDEEVLKLVLGEPKAYHIKEALYEIACINSKWFVMNPIFLTPINEEELTEEEAIKLCESLNL